MRRQILPSPGDTRTLAGPQFVAKNIRAVDGHLGRDNSRQVQIGPIRDQGGGDLSGACDARVSPGISNPIAAGVANTQDGGKGL